MLGNKKTQKAKTPGDANQAEEGNVAESDLDQMTGEVGAESQEEVHDGAADDVSSPHMEIEVISKDKRLIFASLHCSPLVLERPKHKKAKRSLPQTPSLLST